MDAINCIFEDSTKLRGLLMNDYRMLIMGRYTTTSVNPNTPGDPEKIYIAFDKPALVGKGRTMAFFDVNLNEVPHSELESRAQQDEDLTVWTRIATPTKSNKEVYTYEPYGSHLSGGTIVMHSDIYHNIIDMSARSVNVIRAVVAVGSIIKLKLVSDTLIRVGKWCPPSDFTLDVFGNKGRTISWAIKIKYYN